MGTACSISVKEKVYIAIVDLLKKIPSEDLDVDERNR